jgi:hypothetical protein
MNAPSFLEGAALALALSLAGTAALAALGFFLPFGLALRLMIAGLGLAYLAYLLFRSPARSGRATACLLWAALTAVAWPGPLAGFGLAQLAGLWLARSLCFHVRFAAILADLLLNGLALAAGLWAAGRTGSVFAALWCFFLTQAWFSSLGGPAWRGRGSDPPTEDRFERAYRAAETALRRLSNL